MEEIYITPLTYTGNPSPKTTKQPETGGPSAVRQRARRVQWARLWRGDGLHLDSSWFGDFARRRRQRWGQRVYRSSSYSTERARGRSTILILKKKAKKKKKKGRTLLLLLL